MLYDIDNCNRTGIGKRVKEARTERKMTLKEMSERCYMTEPGLSRIENGLSFPSVVTIAYLAKALNVSTDMIIFGKAG